MKRAPLAAAGLLAILVITLWLFRLPVLDSLGMIVHGAFGDKFGWSRTAVKSTPLLLTGLGMVVAWRAGMYNIGGEGQFVIGGLLGAWVAKMLLASSGLPPKLVTVAILVACSVGGAGYAWLAGWLHLKRGVQVVIGTILLNFIALQALGWAVSGPLQEAKGGLPLTDELPDSVLLAKWDPQTDLHAGVLIALLMAVGLYIFLFRTRAGFRLRVAGQSVRLARATRIDASGTQMQAMLLSGALCGLAGGVQYLGLGGQLGMGFSENWGFLGIPVALVGGLHPLLVIVSAGFFGALFAGSENMARFATAGPTLVYVIQGAAVLGFVAVQSLSKRSEATS